MLKHKFSVLPAFCAIIAALALVFMACSGNSPSDDPAPGPGSEPGNENPPPANQIPGGGLGGGIGPSDTSPAETPFPDNKPGLTTMGK